MLNQKISYQIIRSSRRTISLEIKPDGRIIVRAPLRLSENRIRKFVEEKQEWILKNMEKIQKRDEQREHVPRLSALERQHLQNKACVVIPRRVAYFAEKNRSHLWKNHPAAAENKVGKLCCKWKPEL